jgi:hypothetical protein
VPAGATGDVADAYATRRGSGAVEGLLDAVYRGVTEHWEETPV